VIALPTLARRLVEAARRPALGERVDIAFVVQHDLPGPWPTIWAPSFVRGAGMHEHRLESGAVVDRLCLFYRTLEDGRDGCCPLDGIGWRRAR
jgi:hypothetical protein